MASALTIRVKDKDKEPGLWICFIAIVSVPSASGVHPGHLWHPWCPAFCSPSLWCWLFTLLFDFSIGLPRGLPKSLLKGISLLTNDLDFAKSLLWRPDLVFSTSWLNAPKSLFILPFECYQLDYYLGRTINWTTIWGGHSPIAQFVSSALACPPYSTSDTSKFPEFLATQSSYELCERMTHIFVRVERLMTSN